MSIKQCLVGKPKPAVLWQTALVILLIIVAVLIFRHPGMQGVNWTFPYFSGAANFKSIYDWQISPSDFEKVSKMDAAEYLSYRHQSTDDTIRNVVNNYGYVLIALTARSIFPWMGDGNAVVLLQVIAHILIVLVILSLLCTTTQRLSFFILYAINPVVLYFVTFPFYYFWTVLPCFMLALVWLRGGRVGFWIVPIGLSLFLAFLVRPATLFVCLLVFGIAFWKDRIIPPLVALLLFIALAINASSGVSNSPWHTIYVGVGAYKNPYGIELSDKSGFKYYKQMTGQTITTNAISGSFQDRAVRSHYLDTVKKAYLFVLKDNPMLLVRNAIFNTVEAFGFGYNVERPWVSLISGLVGLCMIGLICWTKEWIWGLGILTFAGAFTPYYPPIPAYLFGAYLFTALIASRVVDDIIKRSGLLKPARSRDGL
jgi:hypothetical protein